MMNDCINDYKIMELLGEGAFGKVYKAIGVDRK
jgi:serine/threonine protein kinase